MARKKSTKTKKKEESFDVNVEAPKTLKTTPSKPKKEEKSLKAAVRPEESKKDFVEVNSVEDALVMAKYKSKMGIKGIKTPDGRVF